RFGNLAQNSDGPGGRQRAAALDHPAQRIAREELHHEVRLPRGELAEIGNLDDARMRYQSCGLGLLNEPGRQLLVAREVASQGFQRELPAERDVAHPIHGAHATLTEHAQDLVTLVDDGAEQRIGGWVPVWRVLELLTVERTEAGIPGEVLAARRAH